MQKIILENDKGQNIVLYNYKPYFLEKIEGTETPTSSLIATKAPSQNGKSVHGSFLEERTLILYGGIAGNTIKDMYTKRQELCRVLNPQSNIKLKYINDSGIHEIDCVIEEIEFINKLANMQKFFIQLCCPDPFWKELKELKEEIALWKPKFHFPLIIPKSKGIIMGHRVSNLIINVFNKGDVKCGMKVEFRAKGTVVNPSLFNIHNREFIKVNQTLEAGNRLVIQTSFANKRVLLFSKGIVTNVFHYIDLDSTFLQLEVGDNLLRYDAEQGLDNLEASIYYRPQYLGV